MHITRPRLLVLLAMGAIQPLSAQQSYVGSTPPTISYGFAAFPGAGYLVGQTFTSPGGILNSFGFYAQSTWSGNGTLQAFLFAMTGSAVTGPALYTSAPQPYPSVAAGWLDFPTGGVSFSTGATYIAILAPYVVNSGMAVMDVGAESGNAYPSGAGVYAWALTPTNAAALQAVSWNALGNLTGRPGQDFALRLDYAAELNVATTPEPGSLVLLATGLLGLLGAQRLFRKRPGRRCAGVP